MYIAYFDETGDDGYPNFSSERFVLTSLYLYHLNWKDVQNELYNFKLQTRQQFGIPVKTEIHTKYFLLNKNPYTIHGLSEARRLQYCIEFSKFLAGLDLEFVNVIIDKTMITTANSTAYSDILESALKFNIQRIENTIRRIEPATKFLIISDEGRIGKMRKVTRKIQKINFIPSFVTPGTTYRNEIKMLIEDPLPKDSKESFFIQACDFVSFFVFLYETPKANWHGRLQWLQTGSVEEILNNLKGCLNLKASGTNIFGIVKYPK